MTALTDLIDRFDNPRKSGSAYMARCPAHEDGTPSLRISQGDKGVLLYCYAGCDAHDIVSALGVEWSDLFDAELERDTPQIVAAYQYLRDDGTVHMTVERWREPLGRKTFRQRGTDGEYGLKGTKPCLYNLPTILTETQTIYVTEGEKDADSMTALGLSATTMPMGAGKWQPYYWRWLQHATHVVVVADNDEPGRRHAQAVAADLTTHGIGVTCVRPKWGKDVTDHLTAGHTVEDLITFNPDQFRPVGVTHDDLMRKNFPPIAWTVPGVLGPGLALLGGPPKQGKSWLTLDFALGVAFGGVTMSEIKCNQGDVLYLSLDNDSERRLQDRVARLMAARVPQPMSIEYHTDWPTGDEALKACREWIGERNNPRLICIDTFVKVEPDFDGSPQGHTAYGHSTDVLSRWAKLANDNDLTVLCVHHDRKQGFGDGADGDWINRFTGSRGITASASTLLFLDAKRGADRGTLRMTGRDVGDFDFPLRYVRPFWIAEDMPWAAQPHRHLTPVPEPEPDLSGLPVEDPDPTLYP